LHPTGVTSRKHFEALNYDKALPVKRGTIFKKRRGYADEKAKKILAEGTYNKNCAIE